VDAERSMTKSELIELIAAKQSHLPAKDVELAVKQILEIMSDALAQGQRIEIRGFGSFSLHFRPPRQGRNPKTGETVALAGKYVPHFKPGKDLRERVNEPDGVGSLRETGDDADDEVDDGDDSPPAPRSLSSASPTAVE
jgi:integration host factor subunit beta